MSNMKAAVLIFKYASNVKIVAFKHTNLDLCFEMFWGYFPFSNWQIYLKHLFAGVMIYWLPTFMQIVSNYSPVPNYGGINVHFRTNITTHFTLSFFTFTTVWLEKALLSFKGFRQISKTHPCYFFSHYS